MTKQDGNPKVSIVTICYNAVNELPVTMESVLAQQYSDFEYIIQDGGSTDESNELIESYIPRFQEKGIPIFYNRGPDKGIYDAMNKGALFSSGIWINYMNAGDCFYSSSVLHDVFEGKDYPESTILYGDCAEYEYGGFSLFPKNIAGIETVMPFSHQSVFARRDFLLAHPFNLSYCYSADYDFLLTAHELNEPFTDTGSIICITTKDGLSSVNYHDMLMESSAILKAHNMEHRSEEILAKTEKTLQLKQFVLDHFPAFIKKTIRKAQIQARGQKLDAVVPPWYMQYKK